MPAASEKIRGRLRNATHSQSQTTSQPHLEAAENGDTDAQVRLAEAYLEDRTCPTHLERAFYWYLQAATAGDAHARFNIGAMYHNGEGVERDIIKAVYWFQLAADQGDEDAQQEVLRISKQLREICASAGVKI